MFVATEFHDGLFDRLLIVIIMRVQLFGFAD